ncbi:histidine ammonia-lyase (plasmid) [Rhizobium leguminosarum]|uniref:HAL/PAL/TAL family ammonia-lyase n=1 Tax=Rhizobium leguminosarum TaxID=384 RepID=UPI000DE34594|nr:histidine ammonia-lyase [Rhizobium leguminosarum]MBY5464830.1 histidine ammonia-lyase [Rhizobium leguminosarum]MBY5901597.1 histidine ammonia-lyase [Rhizobium leguminosarum]MBY5908241.1 histidine ammonia-lyase [Rhizobium leguminosarum]NKJ98118.1 histidine ammonia-lyase [Rhizobium leguminosarum bv. viciae]TAU16087.1 histidine ammonia-lyase [Rhizobium leguminosarum]
MSATHSPSIIFSAAPPTIEDIAAVARRHARIEISAEVEARIVAARAVVDRYTANDLPVYGLTTGLGAGVDTRLATEDLVAFQMRVPQARAVGVGQPLAQESVRAMMAVRAAGMAAGGSGVSLKVFHGLIAAINAGVHPVVPSLGSIGAADLAPLAHMSRGLLGFGEIELGGEVLPAAIALERAGLKPLELAPKDGHALVVANSLSIGLACLALEEIERLFDWSLKAIAVNFEAFRANVSVFDDRALAARPAFGQRRVAAELMELLSGSSLLAADAARRLQDPLSYRCTPQVWGALRHAIDEARQATEIELVSSGDNPVVIASEGVILSHGNFDMTAFVLAWERLGQAMAHCAAGTAYRIMKIMSPGMSDLPRFLTPMGQSRTGFATVQKTVSAMEAEIRHLAMPVSLSPIPVADGVEDQASMAPSVLAKTQAIVERLRYLTAIELIASVQAVELRGVSGELGKGSAEAYAFVRTHVPALEEDRAQGPDFATIAALIGLGPQ